MIRPHRRRTSLVCAAALVATPILGTARAQDAERVLRLDDGSGACAVYGPGFVALGSGTCGRVVVSERVTVDGRVRVEPRSRTVSSGAWPANGTSDAALRSPIAGAMLPGISNARHLRVDNGVDPYGR